MLRRPGLVFYFYIYFIDLSSVRFRYGEETQPNFWGSSLMRRLLLLRNLLPTILIWPTHMLLRTPSLLKRLNSRRCCAISLPTRMMNMILWLVPHERSLRSWRPPVLPNKPLFLFLFSLWCLCLLVDSAGSLNGILFHEFGGLHLLSSPIILGRAML